MRSRDALTRLREFCQKRRPASWQLLVGLLVALTIWGLVDVRRRGYAYPDAPGEHKSDLTVYTEAGAAFFDGRPPYAVCNPRGWTYVYPPMFAMVLAPLHLLPMQDQATVWFFLCVAMCWGAYCESRRILAFAYRPAGDWPPGPRRGMAWLGVATVVAVVLPTLNCLQRGQVTIVVVYLLLLGLRLVLTGRSPVTRLAGGVVLAAAVTIKIIPILPVAFLLFIQLTGFLRQRWRRQPRAAEIGWRFVPALSGVGLGLVLFFFLLPAALIGWNQNLRHLGTWQRLVLSSAESSTATPGFEKDTHSVRNQCLGNALYRLGNFAAYMVAGGPEDPLVDDNNPPPRLMDSPCVDTCLLFVRMALLLTLLLVGLRLAGHRDILFAEATGFGLACAALLVVSPVARNHYFVLLAPAVLFVPLWLDGQGASLPARVLAVVPGVLIVAQYLLLPYVGRIGLLGLGTTGWLMAAMVLLVGSGPSAAQCPAVLPDTVAAPVAAPLGKAA
jgi:hypothetical protein